MSVVATVNNLWRFVVLMMPCKMTGGRCLVLGMMLCGLMSWGRLWRSGFAATRSSEGCAAECKAGKSENRKLFESFVHNTPSLSSLSFYADLLCRLQ